MTTKPRARRFRIRSADPAAPAGTATRPPAAPVPPVTPAPAEPVAQPRAAASRAGTAPPAAAPEAAPPQQRAPVHPAGQGTARPAPQTQSAATPRAPVQKAPTPAAKPAPPRPDASATDIAAIRQEGLSGRQLRMARRVAQKHGLEPSSDYDAVRLLRLRGVDPFQRANMLEIVAAQEASGKTPVPAKKNAKAELPQTVSPDQKETLPSTETLSPAERRNAEIRKIQQELAQRRRRKSLLLLARLMVFVCLPTILAGYYFFAVATPMYATKSEFLILKAESSGGGGLGLLSGTQFATNQDAIAVQSYLTSKDAMLRLDADVGFKSHFTQDWIDPIQRLEENPSNEAAYDLYQRHVEIGYDPTEGVIRMEVMAADPDTAADFSRALIGYAEERVDNLSLRKRANAVEDAEQGLRDAEDARREAQERVVRLQQEGAMIDPEGRIAALRSQINTFELQLQEKQLQLQALLDNRRPNASRVDGVQGDIRRLETLLEDLNGQMTSATTGGDSLAEIAIQIRLAEGDLATRDMMLSTALERLDQARRDADSQARYLTTSVEPLRSEDPSYPRAFENTVLAFLIFAGIYLMVSLTASILREQVSS
ncbi:capsule biosynthesis protein [Cognatishimia sp. F0-27]|uniref:capsule biosynthesis protein n=1 Tax=Cognatishimia sp. F0-27 TaxID=2816855 RepID=UPI001D0CD7AE|nr:capsule biosynthesis protein [Cognatishimia sp. F0-27]MCC1492794.1 capsule biosynthesis protein [Cognatishimia sp. F0-27]